MKLRKLDEGKIRRTAIDVARRAAPVRFREMKENVLGASIAQQFVAKHGALAAVAFNPHKQVKK